MSSAEEVDMNDFEGIKIYGHQLFSTREEMMTHIPPHVMPRFKEIINIINNHEAFNLNTHMDYLLKLSFKDDKNEKLDERRSNISQFLNSKKEEDSCVPQNPSPHNFFAWDDLKNEAISKELFDDIEKNLKEDIARLDAPDVRPLSHGSSHAEYKRVIRNICTNIFIRHFTDLQSEFEDDIPEIGRERLMSYTSELCEYVELNSNRTLNYFIGECADPTAQSYYKNVYGLIMNLDRKETAIGDAFKKIFLVCFYPYFVFEFLMNNIATMEHHSLDSAPRFYFVQRIAVLSGYMFLFYTLLTIIDRMGETKLQNEFNKALTILSTINDNLFGSEKISKENSHGYNDLQKQMDKTKTTSVLLQNQTQDILRVRNNLNKAAVNNALMVPQVKSSRSKMYAWLSLLIISIIALSILFFLSGIEIVNMIFYIYSGVVALIVGIAFLVHVFSTF